MADYSNYGLLVDYKYCDNCGSCVVACQEYHDLEDGQYGITVFEQGPWRKDNPTLTDGWDWNYIPVPTDRCDLCAARLDEDKKPMCVKHCLTFCMEVGPLDKLIDRAKELGDKVAIYKPI